MREELEGRQFPLILAHGGGRAHGRENSIGAIRAALKYRPDIIEIDVRKSSDGVLFCHHGSIPFGVSAAQLFRFLPFKQIQVFAGKRDTLQEILREIPETVSVYLDIKDWSITAADLEPLIRGRRNVWVSAYTLSQLRKLRNGLGEDFLYALMRPLLHIHTGVEHAKGVADSIHAFVWQWNAAARAKLEEAGIVCAHVQWLLPRPQRGDGKRTLRPGVVMYRYDDLSATHRSVA
jgi:hypothetical protein